LTRWRHCDTSKKNSELELSLLSLLWELRVLTRQVSWRSPKFRTGIRAAHALRRLQGWSFFRNGVSLGVRKLFAGRNAAKDRL